MKVLLSMILILTNTLNISFNENNSKFELKNKNTINLVIGEAAFESKFGYYPNKNISENIRIKTHLEYVENYLRKKQPINNNYIKQRYTMLNLLKEYTKNEKFPRNYDYKNERKPTFLDKNGNICAVGYLVSKTAGMSLVNEINKNYKYSHIYEMKNKKLENWVSKSGLSIDELQMIQPEYCFEEPDPQACREREKKIAEDERKEYQRKETESNILWGSIGVTMIALSFLSDYLSKNENKIDDKEKKNVNNTIFHKENNNSFFERVTFKGNKISYSVLKF